MSAELLAPVAIVTVVFTGPSKGEQGASHQHVTVPSSEDLAMRNTDKYLARELKRSDATSLSSY